MYAGSSSGAADTKSIISLDRLGVGEVPRGEKMLYSRTDPESYITAYTWVDKDMTKRVRARASVATQSTRSWACSPLPSQDGTHKTVNAFQTSIRFADWHAEATLLDERPTPLGIVNHEAESISLCTSVGQKCSCRRPWTRAGPSFWGITTWLLLTSNIEAFVK